MKLDKTHTHYDCYGFDQQEYFAKCVLEIALDQTTGLPSGMDLNDLIWLAHELIDGERFEFGDIEIVPDLRHHCVVTPNNPEDKAEAEAFERIMNYILVVDSEEYVTFRNKIFKDFL